MINSFMSGKHYILYIGDFRVEYRFWGEKEKWVTIGGLLYTGTK
jgi:hypothetical protein